MLLDDTLVPRISGMRSNIVGPKPEAYLFREAVPRNNKRPRGITRGAGANRYQVVLSLVLGHQRVRSFRCPDPKAKACKDVDTARAHRIILCRNSINDPQLQIDGAEIVTH
jgi:hypothetical protein